MTPTRLATLNKEDVVPALVSEFEAKFGIKPRLFRAPGRVNLIGEHTDYNEGYVMPAAIEFNTVVAISPRADGEVHVVSLNFNEERKFAWGDVGRRSGNWTDYVRGVYLMLGRERRLGGANLMVWGDVPLGAGLSSSASVEVATASAFLGIAGGEAMPREQLALLCQRAENEFVGARCGIMDQFISANGQAGNALLLDCRSLEFELAPIPQEVAIVVSNTMVKHQLASGEYNTRRRECEEGVQLLRETLPKVNALRDVSPEMLEQRREKLPEIIYRRCRHVVSEDVRVLQFAKALRSGDLTLAGKLMLESHRSLRDDYEVSCPELDTMVELALRVPGTVGTRMTGGGFGGCTVSLVRNDSVERFRSDVTADYEKVTGLKPEIYVTRAADGACEIPIH